jgi:DNA-binding GntR family transcriptional regulator
MASYVPLWRRIRQELWAKIDAGILRPGDKLPTTEELADHYQTSRGTVRRAVEVLIEAGILKGRQGVGVFVAESSGPGRWRLANPVHNIRYGKPLWRSIRDDLRAQINVGLLKPGQKLPTTRELMAQYSTTSPTVRRAVDSMIEAGELVGRQGLGVFVAAEDEQQTR